MNKLDFLLALGECNEGMVSEAMTFSKNSRTMASSRSEVDRRAESSLCSSQIGRAHV